MKELRLWANRKYIDLKVWRQKRQAYKDRILVVSNHWDGSVQVFYHFLLGYFAPLARWVRKSGETKIAVRDCGPMNHWFDFLWPDVDVQIVKPGVALHTLAGNRSRHYVVQGLDYPSKHKRSRLIDSREAMLSFIPTVEVSDNPILVIDRASSDDFHSGPLSETEMSGARRRSVPNLPEVAESIFAPNSFVIEDLAQVAPEVQVALARKADVLIGQHGAGLTHMIWMKPGSIVIEIQPPLPDEAVEVFSSLAKALGLEYIRLPQQHVHSAIDEIAMREICEQWVPQYLIK